MIKELGFEINFLDQSSIVSINNKNFKMGYIASTADKTSSNYDKIKTKPVQKLFSNTWFFISGSKFIAKIYIENINIVAIKERVVQI